MVRLQIKVITNEISAESFEEEVNEFLREVQAVDVKITYRNDEYMAVIQYEIGGSENE